MNKNFIVTFILFNLWATASLANSCLPFLKGESGKNPAITQTYTDPDVRFSVTRNQKINEPISNTAVPLKLVASEMAREKLGSTDPRLDSVLTSLNVEGRLYAINTPTLTGYLKSLSHKNLRESHQVQFVFWEGRDSQIQSHITVKGALMDIQPILGKAHASDKMETVDHLALTIRETNSTGEQIDTIVRIPLIITGEKYLTLTPPRLNSQKQFAGYHWGLLLGTDIKAD